MPHFPSPADELRHLEEKQFTVGLTDEEQVRLAALSEPAPAGGGFDVAAAAAGVLAETPPGAGPWTAADYGWDPSDPNAVAWAAYYSELGWDPAAVQAHLAAEAAASAGEAQPEVETAEFAAGEPAPPIDDVAAPFDDLALPSDGADAIAAAPWDTGEPTAALESLGSPLADSLGAPLAEAAVEPAPAPADEPAMPALELVHPEPEAEAEAATAGPSAWDAPAPEASYAPEGEDVPAPVAAAGGTQVWDLSAVQAALAAGSGPAVEAGASAVELLPTFDAGPEAAAASDEPPDFRHDVPPGWPGEPEAALQADFELAGSGSFDPASTAALPGMDALPPAFPDLAPAPEAPPEPPVAAAAPESTDVALDDFDIELEGDDLEPAAEAPEVEHAPADPTDRLAALDLSAPFLGEPEPEPELEPAAGVDWAAAHAVPAGDSAVDLATFEAEPGDESGGGAPAADGDEGGGDATRLWALSEPALAAPPVRLSPVLPALEDEPEPFVAAAPEPLQAIEPEPLPVIEAEPEPTPEPEVVELASAADFLAAAAAAGGPDHATLAPEVEIEPEILEVGDDVLEVADDDAPPAPPVVAVLEPVESDPAVEPPAAARPAPAPPLGLEALFGADEIHDAPAFPDVAAAPAPAVPDGESAPEPPPAAIALGPTDAAPFAAALAPEPRPVPLASPEPAGSDAGSADPFGLEAAVEEPPPEPAAASTAFVAGAHRVVVHTADGQVKRGTLSDVALDAPEVLLAPQSGGEPEALSAERIRAIFFMLPTGEAPPQPEGKRVRVTFRDGRQVAGYSPDYDPQRVGFFMIPADSRTHTARIWVYRTSVRQVSVT
ncbi:MAG TPA: hypothetical protein VFP65_07125 [Anaeromyxobacteraceae bacterium]|nr:hypothetical protein [Anaeromyxobacteraceae bacterium]